ncbi:MAG TPA: GNAT family N-acetyltransferase [Alphaproteobacteria bacterium]|jgi:GNAT superfamily N-acetyltransferase
MSFTAERARIRAATARDAEAMARVFETTWDAAYRGILPAAAFEELPQECAAEYWRLAVEARAPDHSFAVAVDDGDDAVGLATAGPERFGSDGWAELYALYVMPGYQRYGLGRRLLCASFQAMRKRGFRAGIAWVLARHDSRKFYERLGGLGEYERVSEEWGEKIAQAGYIWDDLDQLLREGGPCRAGGDRARAPA